MTATTRPRPTAARLRGLFRELLGTARPERSARQVPDGLYPVAATLLVPERHRIWHERRLWDLAALDNREVITVVLLLVDGPEHRKVVVDFDQDIPALNTRPELDSVDSVAAGRSR